MGGYFMSEELKPKSFRIDDETAKKFKEISSSIGGNQQETLSKLIESYEFQAGKAVLTEKKADIESFEKYVNALTRMYMGSLEDNQTITATVRTEFDALLKSKDTIIQELQEKLKIAKQSKEEFAKKNVELDKQQKESVTKLDNLQSMLQDKENLNQTLNETCKDLREKINTIKQEHNELVHLREQFYSMQQERDELTSEKNKIEKELSIVQEQEQEKLEQQKEQLQVLHEKAILELEKNYQTQILKLKEQKQTEIDKYQQKYFKLLEKIDKSIVDVKKPIKK